MIFVQEEMSVNCQREHATYTKQNTHVILPGPLTAKREHKLECRRVEWSRIWDDYVMEFTDEEGVKGV